MQFRYWNETLESLSKEQYRDKFQFVVQGVIYEVPLSFALAFSPKVTKQYLLSPTITEITIKMDDPKSQFGGLIEGKEVEEDFFIEMGKELENNKMIQIWKDNNKISKENIMKRIEKLRDIPNQAMNEEIEYVAEHLEEHKENLDCLKNDELLKILCDRKVKVESEDTIWAIVKKRIRKEGRKMKKQFLACIKIDFLKHQSFKEIIEEIEEEDLEKGKGMWTNLIKTRILESVAAIPGLESTVATLRSQIDSLESKNSTLESTNEEVLAQNSSLESIIATLHSQITSLESTLATLRSQNASLESTIVLFSKVTALEPRDLKWIMKAGPYKIIQYQSSHPFDGVFDYLSKICEGNVHVMGIVNITASSTQWAGAPHEVVEHGWDGYWNTKNKPSGWLKFDLKERRVVLTGYILKTCSGPENYQHLENWVIEGSNDDSLWEEVDRQWNNNDLNGSDFQHYFLVSKAVKPFQYIRLRMTDTNHHGNNYLVLTEIEIFGNLFTPQK